MALKKKLLLSADTILDMKEKEGTTLEGYYLGSKTTAKGVLHIFNNDKGNVAIWSTKMLDSLLAQINPGEFTRVVYVEKKKIPNNRTMHVFDVESDDENTIDVGTVSKGSNTSYSEGSDELEDSSFEDSQDEAIGEPVQRGHAQATAAAANTAKAFFRKK